MHKTLSLAFFGLFSFAEAVSGHAASLPNLELQIERGPSPAVSWLTQTGIVYRLEFNENAGPANWHIFDTNRTGTGAMLKVEDKTATTPRRFYRVAQSELPSQSGPGISTNAIAPISGQVYPENTLLGSSYLGLQFSIPPNWKGGLRTQSATMLFGSDTEPGLVLGLVALAGNAEKVSQSFNQGFNTSQFGGYAISKAPSTTGNLVTVEWTGVGNEAGVSAKLTAVLHPSGGLVGFMGFFTEANRGVMEQTLGKMVASTVLVPRQVDTQWVNALAGKAFYWVSSSSTGNGGTSGSLSRWTQKNAFFCAGTYEITTQSESSYSGTLSGGGVYGGGSSSNSTEAGDWTVIQTSAGPVMIMASSSGFQSALVTIGPSGNSFYFGDQEFAFSKANSCP